MEEVYLAVRLVDHVLPDGLERAVLLALAVAAEADVSDRHLLSEVEQQTGQVDEVLAVGDKKSVLLLHVLGRLVLVLERGDVAEQARRRRESQSGVGNLSVDRVGQFLLGRVRVNVE